MFYKAFTILTGRIPFCSMKESAKCIIQKLRESSAYPIVNRYKSDFEEVKIKLAEKALAIDESTFRHLFLRDR